MEIRHTVTLLKKISYYIALGSFIISNIVTIFLLSTVFKKFCLPSFSRF